MTISKKEAQPQKSLDSQPVFYVGHSPGTRETELGPARGQNGLTLARISSKINRCVCVCLFCLCNDAKIETSK